MHMKSDQELNYLAATGLLHWTAKDGFFINSMKGKRYAISDYSPLTDQTQYQEIASKMQARDYELTVRKVDSGVEVQFSKYGENFSHIDSTEMRAGTIAALLAYKQL